MTRRRRLGLVLLLVLMGSASACGTAPAGTPTPVIPTTAPLLVANLSDITAPRYTNARVAVSGYLFLGAATVCQGTSDTKTCYVEVHSAPNGKGPFITAEIAEGNGPNQIEPIPEKYSQADLKVHLASGDRVDRSVAVTLIGTHPQSSTPLPGTTAPTDFLNTVDTITRAVGSVPTAIVPTAVPETFDTIPNTAAHQRISVTGYIGLGIVSYCDTSMGIKNCLLALYKQPDTHQGTLSLNVDVGTDKNQMADLPDKFSDADLKVRTDAGEIVGSGTKVTVTGTYIVSGTSRAIDVETIIRAP